MRARAMVAAAVVLVTGALSGTAAQADTIRVQSTTDTVDAGLVDGLLRDAYKAAQPGDTLDYVGVGTGKALDNARAGLADVVITHAPSLEAQFVQQGFSAEPLGRAIFYSDYVVLGPQDDPAGVLTSAPHDAVSAFEQIAAAGAAGRASFVSRGDNSGTNVQEQVIWGLTSTLAKKTAFNAGTATNRSEPSGDGPNGYPAWYRTTNKGQAASLQDADACAPEGASKCYTMVDRGTFNRLLNSGTVTRLRVVSDRNVPTARGGQDLLINPFSAYVVNPDKITTDPRPNVAAGTRFLDFLTSKSFQDAVTAFPSASDPAFRADAFPLATATPPTVGAIGSQISFVTSFANQLPGGTGITGLPAQLQASTDGGASFTDVGPVRYANDAGQVLFAAPVTATSTTFRVALPRFRQFSPNVQTLGVVAGVAVPPAGSGAGATPDRTAPRVSRAQLASKRLRFSVDGAAKVKVTIKRRTVVRSDGRLRFRDRRVKVLSVTSTKASVVNRSFKRLPAGAYRVTFEATDAAGNEATVSRSLRVTQASAQQAARSR